MQQYPQEPQDYGPYSSYQNYSQPTQEGPSDSFLKAMIEVEETVHKFEMEVLRRKRLKVDIKSKTKQWIPMAEGVEPMCNELGIAEILGVIRSRATTIGRLTKKYDEEIMRDMFQFQNTVIELIQLRADDWDLDEELAKPLEEECVGLIQDIVFSSRDGFTATNMRSTYSRHENANIGSDREEGGKSLLGIGRR